MMNLRCRLFMYALAALSLGRAFAGSVVVESGLTQAYNLQPGKRVEGTIVVHNKGNDPQEVRVYQTDYLFWSNGTSDFGQPGSVPRSNSSWISFSPQQFTVPGNSTSSVYYQIQAPNDANLTGTYWSMLMVEPVAQLANTAAGSDPKKIMVELQTVLRYTVQIVTDIGDSGRREIKIAGKQLTAGGDKYTLQLDIENVGERWLRPFVQADVYDAQGKHIGQFSGGRTRIYPGCSVRVPIEMMGVTTGKYNALVVVDNGDQSVWGAQYELEIK